MGGRPSRSWREFHRHKLSIALLSLAVVLGGGHPKFNHTLAKS